MRFVTFTLITFLMLWKTPLVAADDGNGPAVSGETRSNGVKTSDSIRVDVRMALVPVSVLDPSGRNVTGLEKDNFRLIDGKEPRDIASFSREDQPITVGLVFDCSRSMTDKFVVAREAPALLYQSLNDQDESFLVTISDSPALRWGLTSNFGDLRDALLFTRTGGSTALLDSVYLGLAQMKKAKNPRKALIVVSDGGDNNSRYTLRELKKVAMEADTQIFAIGLHDTPKTPEEELGPSLLDDLARASGGIQYTVQRPAEISEAMAKIAATLHNEYVLGYYPPTSAQSGKYRAITVQLHVPSGMPPLHIYSRAGYYMPEQ